MTSFLGADNETRKYGPALYWFFSEKYQLKNFDKLKGDFYHSKTPLYWNLNEDGMIVETSSPTQYKTWIPDDWKRLILTKNTLFVDDYIFGINYCEKSFRLNAAYFGPGYLKAHGIP